MDRAGRVALCLTLGAATTLAVAWVLAVRVTVPVPGRVFSTTGGVWRDEKTGSLYGCHVKQRPGLTAVVWLPAPVPSPDLATKLVRPVYEAVPRKPSNGIDPAAVPWWARETALVNMPDTFTTASARGWPMQAMWYEGTLAGGRRLIDGGLFVPRGLAPLGPGQVLPCRPIAEGLAVDSVFYAALWYGVFVVPGALRRASRRSRGLCARCGYDLAHSGHDRCPECGAAVPCFC